jgi:transcriptional regulator with XRE-family HTH domain
MEVKDVVARLKALREARNWSRNYLEDAAQLAHGYVTKLEANRIPNPGLLQLQKLSEALGLPLSRVLIESEVGPATGEKEVGETAPVLTPDLADVATDILTLRRLDAHRMAVARTLLSALRTQAEAIDRRTRRVKPASATRRRAKPSKEWPKRLPSD